MEEALQSVIDAQLKEPGVATAKMFGALGLGVGGKYFAMFYRGKLVVKLPRPRVEALVTQGYGERFDPGHGRVMKEWVALGLEPEVDWKALADEARQFVAAGK